MNLKHLKSDKDRVSRYGNGHKFSFLTLGWENRGDFRHLLQRETSMLLHLKSAKKINNK